MTKRSVVFLVLAAATAALPGTAQAAVAADAAAAPAAGLKPFESCSSLIAYGNRHARRYSSHLGRRPMPMLAAGGIEDAAARAEPQAGVDFSTTNLQEAGVDEPDVVKTDGTRIFAVAGGKLHAVDASGESARLLDSVRLGHAWDAQLLLHGDRLVAIWSDWSRSDWTSTTMLAEIDVSDPAALRIVRTLSVEGDLAGARMTGSTARVVVTSSPRAIALPARRRSAARWLPAAELRDRRSGRVTRRAAVSCTGVRHAPRFSGLDTVTVLTIDIARGLEPIDTDAILTDADTVYASPTGLYVATRRWTRQNMRSRPAGMTTEIHRFDTADPARTVYRGSGVVPGYLLSQWSLSEHDGVLRVASTDGPEWWEPRRGEQSQSFVTTLREDPVTHELAEVGTVGGLGRGERIYAVRFIDDMGYVVTFRETDPLYTIDLSDPAAPRVAGELKIRGYSAYLHPAGDGLLIGVGQDATERGETLGTQISLFDVSDPANPVRLHRRTLAKDSSSEAEWDHHAFLWWPAARLAVLPVARYDERDPFAGAVGLRIDRDAGIEPAGELSHPGDAYEGAVRRALVVGGRLFTLSERGLRVSALDTLASTAWVPFG